MSRNNSKSKPKHCGKTMHRLYIRKGTEKRKWIAVGYYCDECSAMMKEYDLKKIGGIQNLPADAFRLVDKIPKPSKIVLDLGFSFTKVGFAGEKTPRFIFDSAVYIDEKGDSFIQFADKVEIEFQIKKKSRIFNTVNNQEELDKDIFEIFIAQILEKLKTKSDKTAVWVIENNIANRRAIAEVLFNGFNFSKVYFSVGELLSLYADNQVTGVVVGIGANSTRIVPIYEGYIISHGLSIREKGGLDVTKQLEIHIKEGGLDKSKSYQDNSQMLKNSRLAAEEFCYVSQDITTEHLKWQESDKYVRSVNI
ncbi:MAG: hypothetical protein ACTSQF_10570, partial [Candidatus Heimdallarchaeaceae archaeon]